MPRQRKAFTLVEIMIVVAILGILLSISVPAYLRARENSRQTACQENLIQIDHAIQRYTIDYNVLGSEPLSVPLGHLVSEEKFLRFMPVCPSGGTYVLGAPDDYEPVICTIRDPSMLYPHIIPQVLAEAESAAGS